MDRFLHLHNLSIHSSCRTCLENLNDSHHNIFATPDLQMKFSVCTSLLVEPGDELPTSLCEPCHSKINDFYDFKLMCLSAIKRFQEYINSDKKPNALELGIEPKCQKSFEMLNENKEPDQYPLSSEHGLSSKEELDKLEDHQAIIKYEVEYHHSDKKPCALELDIDPYSQRRFKLLNECEEENYDQYSQTSEQQPSSKEEDLDKSACNRANLNYEIECHNSDKKPCALELNIDQDSEKRFEVLNEYKEEDHDQYSQISEKEPSSKEDELDKSGDNQSILKYEPNDISKTNESVSLINEIKAAKNKKTIMCNEERRFECNICHGKFKYPSNLKRHKKFHLKTIKGNESLDNKLTNFESQHEPSSKTDKVYDDQTFNCKQCEICKKFVTAENFESHMRVHKGLKPYGCLLCEKQFKCSSAKKRHEISHNKVRPYKCNICHGRFKYPHALKRHKKRHLKDEDDNKLNNVERQHEPSSKADKVEKFYKKCDISDKFFSKAEHLERHMRVHNGLKPYACSYCEKSFGYSFVKKQHEMIHTGEKPYECNICQRKFTQRSVMKKHKKIHVKALKRDKSNDDQRDVLNTFYCKKCEICKKFFSKAEYFESHMRVHKGLKPYACSYCEKEFTCSSGKKYHEASHNHVGSYECNICHVKFNRPCILKKHIKTHLK